VISRQNELERLGARPFAHRGLHGRGRIENSRAAFEAAILAGSGIELDVQASGDGTPFVFHDDALERLTAGKGPFASRCAADLCAIRLTGSDETIPTLAETLRLIRGRAPLLIELKSPGRHTGSLCRAAAAALAGYEGPAAIMSFNPEIGRWFARHAPDRLRGLVVTEHEKGALRGRLERGLGLWRSRADFLAYDIRDLPSVFAAAVRRRGKPVFTWTVRTSEERARAAADADQIIYEEAAQ
jgi:glycerophosphoryl diester phosphodiesterase